MGETATLTCSSDLSGATIEWVDLMGGMMSTIDDTAVLTFDPVTDDLNGTMLTCMVTATNGSMYTRDITVSVEG